MCHNIKRVFLKIQINAIKNYAKNNGLNYILQAKPVQMKKLSVSDIFISLNSFFYKMTDAENLLLPNELHNTKMGKAFVDVIPKLEAKDYEQAFVFDQSGNLIARSKTKRKFGFNFSKDDSIKIEQLGTKNVMMGMIHKHPNEVTFSYLDLVEFHRAKYVVTMAKTPKGYAFLQKNKELTEDYIDLLEDLYMDVDAVGIKLSKGNYSRLEDAAIYNKIQNQQYIKLAQKMNMKYDYKPGDTVLNENQQAIFNIKKIYKNFDKFLIENGWMENAVKKFITQIDETSLDELCNL